MVFHKMEFDTPVSPEEAMKKVLSVNYFGYHPAGYGGHLFDSSYQQVVQFDNNTMDTVYYWGHWESCD
jgi:hypothetical protein